jgi:hypothetical protein
MSRFEDRLLDELRDVVTARPTPAVAAVAAPRPSRRPRVALAGGGGLAAVAAGVVLATSGGGVSPAYAVEKQDDGTVTVHISSLADADGLQSKLRAEGVPAVVTYDTAGGVGTGAGVPACAVPPNAGPPALTKGAEEAGVPGDGPSTSVAPEAGGVSGGGPSQSFSAAGTSPKDGSPGRKITSSTRVDADGTTFSVNPGALKPGEKVYLTTAGGQGAGAVGMAIC